MLINPAIAISAPTPKLGKSLPMDKAKLTLNPPLIRFFTIATCTASLEETLYVRLLDVAQPRQAPTTASEPQEKRRAASPVQAKIMLPEVIAASPRAICRLKASRKMNQAIRAVNTPSKLSSKEAEAAVLWAMP